MTKSRRIIRPIIVLLAAMSVAFAACGDEGSAGPDAGYTVGDIVSDPGELVGKELVVSGAVGDVFRPHAFTLESDDGKGVLVVSPDQVVEGSVARVTGRVVTMPVEAEETSPDVAAFVRSIPDDTYEHAIVAREVDKLEGSGEY
jgi:hypothetical protein